MTGYVRSGLLLAGVLLPAGVLLLLAGGVLLLAGVLLLTAAPAVAQREWRKSDGPYEGLQCHADETVVTTAAASSARSCLSAGRGRPC